MLFGQQNSISMYYWY